MKLNLWKRILMFCHWLFTTLGCAALATFLFNPRLAQEFYDNAAGRMSATQMAVAGFAFLAIFIALAIAQLWLIFRRRKPGDRGYIEVDSSDAGRVRIAVSAIEQMVRQSVTNIDGIEGMEISISNDKGAIAINIVTNIVSGSHVPTLTQNMQRAIRQFVQMNCGVAVRSVSISINAVAGGQDTRGWWSKSHRTPALAPTDAEHEAAGASESPAGDESAARPNDDFEESEAEQPAAAESAEPVYPADPAPIRLTLDPAPQAAETPEEAPAEDEAEEKRYE